MYIRAPTTPTPTSAASSHTHKYGAKNSYLQPLWREKIIHSDKCVVSENRSGVPSPHLAVLRLCLRTPPLPFLLPFQAVGSCCCTT